ncbi:DUF881 domain-containing protein [Brachybacterium alimentarium]|uniref:DUF881 domain-containing protein n=1 Tax=Brachybacterium alimentarium TaxID=47845 RepID=A0A2A3YF51_9MICO|nr:DUF881 domain-containing protein [Brachybacterium alimentarium]PCC30775.1 hypothetical protein CIK71_16795 [Brachybacterium alimentarium]PCC37861.1 hypothetical protein CIK66_17165 [Brachybacterium alimentarium]RCS68194.1 DUF881 domain-containing protein [Brachybacterium alimentarium]RCS68441.1 DUF881 domain-containing protein [Brachybacterium alimentarium]RCS76613.1 DUF881 domain-containing protein [Brachybacterium alimentarium]
MSDGTRTPESPEQQKVVWTRLRETLRPQATWTQLIVGLLCVLLGLAIAAQLRQSDDSLEGASQQELVRLLDESGRHAAGLEVENAELDRTLESLRSGAGDDAAARTAAEERLEDLEIIAGTSPAHGRGIVVSISDPDEGVRASTLLGVVQELRNAGAEVIQIGDVRVVASTSITTAPSGRLQVDGTPVPVPYTLSVIGDPEVMEPALRIPGGAADSVTADGGTLAVASETDVQIDATVELSEPEHSRVVK